MSNLCLHLHRRCQRPARVGLSLFVDRRFGDELLPLLLRSILAFAPIHCVAIVFATVARVLIIRRVHARPAPVRFDLPGASAPPFRRSSPIKPVRIYVDY